MPTQAQHILALLREANAEKIKVVCGWCPTSREETAKAEAAGYIVSHGICPACVKKMDDQIDARQPSA